MTNNYFFSYDLQIVNEILNTIHAITNSMENLRFDKEGYFHVLVFYGLFYKRNRKHFPRVPIAMETLVEVSLENEK